MQQPKIIEKKINRAISTNRTPVECLNHTVIDVINEMLAERGIANNLQYHMDVENPRDLIQSIAADHKCVFAFSNKLSANQLNWNTCFIGPGNINELTTSKNNGPMKFLNEQMKNFAGCFFCGIIIAKKSGGNIVIVGNPYNETYAGQRLAEKIQNKIIGNAPVDDVPVHVGDWADESINNPDPLRVQPIIQPTENNQRRNNYRRTAGGNQPNGNDREAGAVIYYNYSRHGKEKKSQKIQSPI